VRDADRIVVIKDGEIGEVGSHAELIGGGGYYASLVARQTQGFLEDAERAA
jgi:ATP-binding cassette subfamily B protein